VQLERLHQKYREQGLVVLGLNHESNQADVRKFAQIRISYPVLLGATRPCQEYGARLIPAFFYVDREGIVRYQENGFSDGRERDIEARIRELLGSGPGPKDKPPG
jgi:hypothetical protein